MVLDRDLIVRVQAVPGCNQGVVQTRVVLYLSSNLLLSMPSEGQSVRTAGLEGTGLNYLDELLTPSTAGVELIHPRVSHSDGHWSSSNSRKSSDENNPEHVHTILSRPFETGPPGTF